MGKSSFGASVKLTGESEYQKALRGISDNLKVLKSEMKTVTSQFDRNDKSVSNLNQQKKVLNKQIDEQKEKVKVLTKALQDAKNETGENSDTTKLWQTNLNNANAELNRMKKQVQDNTKALQEEFNSIVKAEDGLEDYAKETKNAGEKTSRLGDIIKGQLVSQAIIGGVKALGSAMLQLGRSMVRVGQQSFESFAQYEQLVGGVDTLFKDASKQVQEYANVAYKTAGMSANTYMETVTGFSASLLQSLGGDTKKVAEVSNMAIIDMSDNANKMGTSMESIRYAYMGFAKQNYTMLDNLKLGYGGTKAEMQRLLADAQKVTGVKYDIANLNDVYQALHVIQGELGITGTTALESATTIEGSMNSLKASWSNLLVGMAGGGDLNVLTKNLVDSFKTAMDNVLPTVMKIVTNLAKVIPDLLGQVSAYLPEMTQQGIEIVTALVLGMAESVPLILESVNGIVNNLVTGIKDILPVILTSGIEIIVNLLTGITQSLPTLIPAIVDGLIACCNALIDNIDLIIDAGVQLILGLAEGLIEAIPKLIDAIPTIIEKLVTAIVKNLPKIYAMGVTLTVKLGYGIVKAIPKLIALTPQIISALVKGLCNGLSQMIKVGKDLINGLWQGIKEKRQDLKYNIANFGDEIVNMFKDVFGIHSPSRVMRDKIGKNIALGIAEGIKVETKSVTKALKNLANSSLSVAKSTFKNSGFEKVAVNLANSLEKSINSYSNKSINTIVNLVNKQVKEASKKLDKNGKKEMEKVGKATIKAYTDAITSYSKTAKELIAKTLDGVLDKYEEKYKELVKKQEDLQKTFSDYGDLFYYDENGNMVLNDIKEQTRAITDYFSHLQTIKGKIGKDLFEAISQMSVEEGDAFVKQLLSMSNEELKAYNKTYKDKVSTTKQLSKDIYQGELDKINSDYNIAIDKALKDIDKKLKKIGTQTMQGFIKGMKDEKKNLTKAGDELVDALTKSLKKKLGIKSPSKVYKEEIGKNLALGIEQGFSDTMGKVKGSMASAIPTSFDTTSSNINGNNLSYGNMVSAFKDALKQMKVELDDREVGSFVTRTVERQVFA